MTLQPVVRNNRATLANSMPPSLPLGDIVVGRDVLELVSSAMYIDPMTIYREYIQNAADAVDEAKRSGLIASDELGRVDITIDPTARSIKIRDNGIGIRSSDFAGKLSALGASGKRGTTARGFRGVGRLAGLGYAQELIFRSRTKADPKVSELVWDCRKLKATLRQTGTDGGIESLIQNVATLYHVDGTEFPERFFEVELRGVIRLRSDKLMSPAAVSDYLSQVAPVPFAPDFTFGVEINATLRAVVNLGELDIRIDGGDVPLYRPHRNQFTQDDQRTISFQELNVLEIPGIDGDVAAIAWVLHHDYEGALPSSALMKGLRLRSGNVQIGDHVLLEELFPEERFNSWSVGEVHVVDRKIVPNGRRDHFEQNAHFNNLTNQLAPTARDIARRCRTSSVRRKWIREFDIHGQVVQGMIDVISQGSVSRTERERLALSAEQTLMQMTKIAGMELVADPLSGRDGKLDDLKAKLGAAMHDETAVSSPLMRLPEAQRKTYEHFFELIYQCSANRVAAMALIDRILMRLE